MWLLVTCCFMVSPPRMRIPCCCTAGACCLYIGRKCSSTLGIAPTAKSLAPCAHLSHLYPTMFAESEEGFPIRDTCLHQPRYIGYLSSAGKLAGLQACLALHAQRQCTCTESDILSLQSAKLPESLLPHLVSRLTWKWQVCREK